MKKLLALSLLLVSCSGLASSSNSEHINIEATDHSDDSDHSGGGGLPQGAHILNFHGNSNIFPNATYSHTEPSTKNIVYSGEARITQAPDNSPRAIFGDAVKKSVSMLVQFAVRDAYEGLKDKIFPNEEKELQDTVQQVQIRRAEQQLDAEKENIEFMKEIRENIAIIRTLNAKEAAGKKITEQEKQQKESAARSLTLMQAMLGQHAAQAA